jgi:hypothetical protein
MCDKETILVTQPDRQLSKYFKIYRESVPITDDTPQALCPDCGAIVFEFINTNKKRIEDEKEESGSLS